mmetsp:Transcript_9209/g.27563  ORF Transcript_9209/g.27563 Transcript_9209/m.27563 type:complete len:337 (+) Transcript_9209:252-1262(+)
MLVSICFSGALAMTTPRRFDVARHLAQPDASTPYAKPVEIGRFSRVGSAQHLDDARALREYRAPRLPQSLALGYDAFVPKRGDLAESEAALTAAASSHTFARFVTYRNNLNKIAATPYNLNDDWEVGVRPYNDGYLLRVRETARRAASEREQSEEQKLWSYYGYKFEALCTQDRDAIDANDEYVALFKCKLGDHRLCVAAEIDARDAEGYVELKTNKLLASKRLVSTFERFKLFRIWLQSYLVGTPKVVIGFRDDGGELRKLQEFEVLALPNMAHSDRSKPPPWRPKRALAFADAVLTWLAAALEAEPGAYVMRYEPEDRAVVLRREDDAKRRRPA